MIPPSFCRVAGTIGVRMSSSGRNFSAFLLTPPPTTMRSGQKQALDGAEVAAQPLRPLLPGQALGLPHAVGGAGLGVLAVELEVAELGVGHEHAVDETGRCRCRCPSVAMKISAA